MNPTEVLKTYRKIAVVGLSPKANRPSHSVSLFMKSKGYEMVGVRPGGHDEIEGIKVFETLSEVPGSLEIVDVFRASEHIPALVDELIALKPKVLWLQEGISHPEAEARAEAAGMVVIRNRCVLKEYYNLS